MRPDAVTSFLDHHKQFRKAIEKYKKNGATRERAQALAEFACDVDGFDDRTRKYLRGVIDIVYDRDALQ